MNDEFHAPGYRQRRRASMLFVATGALVMVGTALWLWDRVRTLEANAATTHDRLVLLAERESTLATHGDDTARALADLASRHGDITARVDALQGARRSGLLAAEAEYLARLAAQRLALAQDPGGALALLEAADAALRDIPDADVHAARAAIAADSARLRVAAAVDVEATWLRLDALPPRVDAIAGQALPRGNVRRTAPGDSNAEPAGPPRGSAWDRLGEALGSLVSLRRVDAPQTPLVTAGERALAAQNFRLLVEQAQLALMQRRAGIYRQSLGQAGRWLDRIVSGDPVARNAVRRDIALLLAVPVEGGGLELSASLAATRALATRLLPEARP